MGLKFSHNVLVLEEVASGQLDVNEAKILFDVFEGPCVIVIFWSQIIINPFMP